MNELCEQRAYANEGMLKQRRLDVTLRQNLDEQIARADAHAAYLREIKARMEVSGILDMRIEDLSTAMRF